MLTAADFGYLSSDIPSLIFTWFCYKEDFTACEGHEHYNQPLSATPQLEIPDDTLVKQTKYYFILYAEDSSSGTSHSHRLSLTIREEILIQPISPTSEICPTKEHTFEVLIEGDPQDYTYEYSFNDNVLSDTLLAFQDNIVTLAAHSIDDYNFSQELPRTLSLSVRVEEISTHKIYLGEITLPIHSEPISSSIFKIYPSIGYPAETVFEATALGWGGHSGDSLQYSLLHRVDDQETTLVEYQSAERFTFTMPMHPSWTALTSSWQATIVLAVRDESDCSVELEKHITLQNKTATLLDFSSITGSVSTSLESSDPASVAQAVSQLRALEQAAEGTTVAGDAGCTDCSGHGACLFDSTYNQSRCQCEDSFSGPHCQLTQEQSTKILELKTQALQKLSSAVTPSSVQNMTTDQLDDITQSLRLLSAGTVSNTTIVAASITTAQNLIDAALASQDYSKLSTAALEDITNVASSSMESLYTQDCALNDAATRALYQNSLDTLKKSGFASLQKDPSRSSTIQTSVLTLRTERYNISELNDKQVSLGDNEPGFSLNIPSNTDEEEVDIQTVAWKKDMDKCPSDQDDKAVKPMTLELYKRGTLEPHPVAAQVSVDLYYPASADTTVTCRSGCTQQVSNKAGYARCACKELSELTMEKQFLSVFADSNIHKVLNADALKDFEYWNYVGFWVLSGFDMMTLVLVTLFVVKKYCRSSPLRTHTCFDNCSPLVKTFLVTSHHTFLPPYIASC